MIAVRHKRVKTMNRVHFYFGGGLYHNINSQAQIVFPFAGDKVVHLSSTQSYTALTIGSAFSFVADDRGYCASSTGAAAAVSSTAAFGMTGQKISVSFWYKVAAYTNNDALLMETSINVNGNPGFYIDPNEPTGNFAIACKGAAGTQQTWLFTRPAAGVWHHVVAAMDNSATKTGAFWLDGNVWTPTSKPTNQATAGTFTSQRIFFFSRGDASLFCPGMLQNVVVFNNSFLNSDMARTLYEQPWVLFRPVQRKIYVVPPNLFSAAVTQDDEYRTYHVTGAP